MKLLCILFSILVLLLTVRPCCADTCLEKGKAPKENGHKPNPKECRGCSPFFSCGTCAGFVLVNRVPLSLRPTIESNIKHNSVYSTPFLKQVVLSIWQPPQIG